MEALFREGLFVGRAVLVTGGGSGIGLTAALEMARLGAKVAICGRRPEKLEAAATLFAREGLGVLTHGCDTRVPEQIEAFVGAVLAAFGGVDVLVNNAGGQFPTTAQGLSPRGFEAVVRNNLLGTWNMTHAVATKAFIPKRQGAIVNVIAQISRGFPGMVHTGAARAGVENMTKTIAVEWAQFGIRANCIAPGIIRTSGTDQYPPEILEMGRKATPLKRFGTAEEVAHLITYLASPAAAFITGQTFTIDGGQSLWGDTWTIPDSPEERRPEDLPIAGGSVAKRISEDGSDG